MPVLDNGAFRLREHIASDVASDRSFYGSLLRLARERNLDNHPLAAEARHALAQADDMERRYLR